MCWKPWSARPRLRPIMFTGIVTDVGDVRAIIPGGDTGFRIATRLRHRASSRSARRSPAPASASPWSTRAADWFAVTASAETLARTTLGDWRVGTRSISSARSRAATSWAAISSPAMSTPSPRSSSAGRKAIRVRFVFEVPAGYEVALAPKGSVALDGVSLTVNEVIGRRFGVNIIPHTQAKTDLRHGRGRRPRQSRDRCPRPLRCAHLGKDAWHELHRGHVADRGDHRRGAQRPHVHPGRRRGPRERGRPRHPGADGDARGDQFHGQVRPRPHLPRAHRASAASSCACR